MWLRMEAMCEGENRIESGNERGEECLCEGGVMCDDSLSSVPFAAKMPRQNFLVCFTFFLHTHSGCKFFFS